MVNNTQQRLNALRDRSKQLSWFNDRIEEIAEEIIHTDSDITIATYEQGEGKSTAVCCILQPNDCFLLPTHKQVADKREVLDILDIDYIHFFSLRKMTTIDEDWDTLNPDHLQEELTDEVLQARRETGREKLQEIDEAIRKLPQGETEPVKRAFEEEPILELYKNQIEEIAGTSKVVLGTKHFFPALSHEEKLSDTESEVVLGDMFLDEGVEREVDSKRLNLNSEVRVFDNGFDSLTPERFQANLEQLHKKFWEFDSNFTEIWDMYLDFLEEFQEVYDNTPYYDTGKNKKGNYRVKVISTKDFSTITPEDNDLRMDFDFVQFWNERITKKEKYNDIKSEFQIEIANQMEEENEEMVEALVTIKKIFDFFHRWFLYTNTGGVHEEIWIEQYVTPKGKKKPPKAEVGNLSVEKAFGFQHKEDRDLVITHAEASREWLEKAWEQVTYLNYDFDDRVEFIGENTTVFDATSYLVTPAQDKQTLTKTMASNGRWEKIYHDINNLHAQSDFDVGVVCYKDIADQFNCPVLWWGNKTGHNKLQDVDVLFVLGSPRPPAKEYLRQRFFLTGDLPDEDYQDLIDTDGKAQVGLDDEMADLIFTNIVDRDVRDAVGRMRDQTDADIVFRVGLDSRYVDFDEQIDVDRMRGEMGFLFGMEEWQEVTVHSPESNAFLSYSSKDGISYEGLTQKLPEGVTMDGAKATVEDWDMDIEWSRMERAIRKVRIPHQRQPPHPSVEQNTIPVRWYNSIDNAY